MKIQKGDESCLSSRVCVCEGVSVKIQAELRLRDHLQPKIGQLE